MPATLSSPPASQEGAPETNPPCFGDGYDFDLWNYWNRISRELRAPNFCADCTPQYQRWMLDIDKCPHPETKFYVFEGHLGEPEVVGLRKPPSPWQERFVRGEVPPV